jgi:hypothetical protein
MSIETALPVATGKLLQVLYRVHIGDRYQGNSSGSSAPTPPAVT